MLAHHFQCAYDLTRAAGADASLLAAPARLALRDAGDRALSLNAFPAAARFFSAALELWPLDDPERPSLLFHLGKSTYYAETAGAEVLEEARDALLAVGDHETAAEAETFLAYLAHHHGPARSVLAEHLDRAAGAGRATSARAAAEGGGARRSREPPGHGARRRAHDRRGNARPSRSRASSATPRARGQRARR